jgi:hypothetical protein
VEAGIIRQTFSAQPESDIAARYEFELTAQVQELAGALQGMPRSLEDRNVRDPARRTHPARIPGRNS